MNGQAGPREDPLLASWLRRHPRIAPLAGACMAQAFPLDAAGPSVVDASPVYDCVRRSVQAVAIMRSSLEIARKPVAGEPGAESPGRIDTLAAIEAESWGAFLAAFLTVELNERLGLGAIDEQQLALLHLAAPVVALATARQSVSVTAAAFEIAGEVAQSGEADLDRLLRDAIGLARRAGNLRALELDALPSSELHAGLAALMGRASACLRGLTEPRLVAASRVAIGALERATLWLESGKDHAVLQAGAPRLAATLARGLELALLCEHAQWMMDHGGDRRGFAAALRFSRLPVDQVHEVDLGLDRALLAPPGGK